MSWGLHFLLMEEIGTRAHSHLIEEKRARELGDMDELVAERHAHPEFKYPGFSRRPDPWGEDEDRESPADQEAIQPQFY